MGGLSNIKNKLLAEQIQEQIFRYIVDTPIEIGEKLPNEFVLGEKFGVGRSTIREAVKLLSSRGVLEVRHGSGTYVVSTTPMDQDPLGILKLTDKMSLAMELADIRMLLEPGLAEMAANNADEEDIKKLRRLCDLAEKKIKSGGSYVEEDIAFHTCVAECSKNRVAEQLIPIIDTAVLMFVNVTHMQLIEETIQTHRAIANAIADKDPIGARAAMMMHMTYNRNLIKELKEKSE